MSEATLRKTFKPVLLVISLTHILRPGTDFIFCICISCNMDFEEKDLLVFVKGDRLVWWIHLCMIK